MSKRKIRVVAAQIEHDGRYLITQRKPTSSLPLLWEFPGGRVAKACTHIASFSPKTLTTTSSLEPTRRPSMRSSQTRAARKTKETQLARI